ncbi:ubiquitin-related domain-containing protein [Scheffersomyces amazonensis]|uniref:ubiquitin-related domain-containing protein n=1 Tax=Scheffersomyces amazonensis TaxID=1078765 RepID=UPI00315D0B34
MSSSANPIINLKVVHQTTEVYFKIKRKSTLKRVLESFSRRLGQSVESLRFMIDGHRVTSKDTPEKLKMEDGDVIEAVVFQASG